MTALGELRSDLAQRTRAADQGRDAVAAALGRSAFGTTARLADRSLDLPPLAVMTRIPRLLSMMRALGPLGPGHRRDDASAESHPINIREGAPGSDPIGRHQTDRP